MDNAEFRVSRLLKTVFVFVGAVLFVTGTFLSVDWVNYFTGSTTAYAAYAKPLVSLLCAIIAFLALRNSLGKSDYGLLVAVFVCIVIVDVTMSIYVYSANKALGSSIFFVGAGLSIVAHILLVIRHAKGFKFFKEQGSALSRWGFPAAFFLPVIGIFIILSPFLMKVGQFWPSLIYALILTTSLWVAWEAFRHHLFPRTNAWLLALGVTLWFVCELVGVVHNIDIGPLSKLAMNLTWHFYMPAILLLALSGHRYGTEKNE